MKTKTELVEFLEKHKIYMRNLEGYYLNTEVIADKLIEAGFVKIQEPRTFWLYKHKGDEYYRTTNVHPDSWFQDKKVLIEVIKVIEVLE